MEDHIHVVRNALPYDANFYQLDILLRSGCILEILDDGIVVHPDIDLNVSPSIVIKKDKRIEYGIPYKENKVKKGVVSHGLFEIPLTIVERMKVLKVKHDAIVKPRLFGEEKIIVPINNIPPPIIGVSWLVPPNSGLSRSDCFNPSTPVGFISPNIKTKRNDFCIIGFASMTPTTMLSLSM